MVHLHLALGQSQKPLELPLQLLLHLPTVAEGLFSHTAVLLQVHTLLMLLHLHLALGQSQKPLELPLQLLLHLPTAAGDPF